MNNSQRLLQIRNKKLGLLILDARNTSRRDVAECAQAIGVTPGQFSEFESGAASPSLPQLELLALFFNLPIEHFFGKQALSPAEAPQVLQDKDRLVMLRNRMIGANLRLARNTAGLAVEDLSQKTGIPSERINRYEMGAQEAPVTELEILANALNLSFDQLYDIHGPIGKWRVQQGSMRKFLDLPPELQQFVTLPVNRPYLELAMRLSDLSAEKLRAVAEVLLEITY